MITFGAFYFISNLRDKTIQSIITGFELPFFMFQFHIMQNSLLWPYEYTYTDWKDAKETKTFCEDYFAFVKYTEN